MHDAGPRPCALDVLVQARVDANVRDCSSSTRLNLPECVDDALDDDRGAYWISEQRPGTDSLLQDAVVVDADGNVEFIDWDSDPNGSRGYAPSASVFECRSFHDDASLGCDEADGDDVTSELLCAFGTPA